MISSGILNKNLKVKDTGALRKLLTNFLYKRGASIKSRHNMLSYCKHKAGESSLN